MEAFHAAPCLGSTAPKRISTSQEQLERLREQHAPPVTGPGVLGSSTVAGWRRGICAAFPPTGRQMVMFQNHTAASTSECGPQGRLAGEAVPSTRPILPGQEGVWQLTCHHHFAGGKNECCNVSQGALCWNGQGLYGSVTALICRTETTLNGRRVPLIIAPQALSYRSGPPLYSTERFVWQLWAPFWMVCRAVESGVVSN